MISNGCKWHHSGDIEHSDNFESKLKPKPLLLAVTDRVAAVDLSQKLIFLVTRKLRGACEEFAVSGATQSSSSHRFWINICIISHSRIFGGGAPRSHWASESEWARAILSFANSGWNVRNSRWCSHRKFRRISPHTSLPLCIIYFEIHTVQKAYCAYLTCQKGECLRNTFLFDWLPFFGSSAHAGKK